MAEQIRKDDIAEADVLANIIPTSEQITLLEKMDEVLNDIADTAKNKLNDSSTIQGIQEQIQAQKELNTAYEKKIEIDKTRKKAEKTQRDTMIRTVKVYQNQNNELVLLQKRINTYKDRLKKLRKEYKNGEKTQTEYAKEMVDINLNLKKSQKEFRTLQKGIINLSKEEKQEQKVAEARMTIRHREIKSIQDARDVNKALRIVIKQTDVTTQEGARAVAEMNARLDDNNEFIRENSDSLTQQKMNVGNYTQSIMSAFQQVGIFNTGLSGLDATLNTILGRLVMQRNSLDKNTASVGRLSKAFRGLGRVLKVTGITVAIAAIAGVVSVFKQGDEGAKRMQKTVARLQVYLSVFFDVMMGLGKALIGFFQQFPAVIKNIGLNIKRAFTFNSREKAEIDKQIKDTEDRYNELGENITAGINQFKDAIRNLPERLKEAEEQIKKIGEAIDKIFNVRRDLIDLHNELQVLENSYDNLQNSVDDVTKSIEQQIEAQKKADEKELEVLNKRVAIAKKERDRIEAEITKSQSKSTQSSIDNDEKLAEANRKVNQSIHELNVTRFKQEQDGLKQQIDLFTRNFKLIRESGKIIRKTQKDIVKDETKSIDERIDASEKYRKSILDNTQAVLNSFTDIGKKLGKDYQFEVDDAMNIFVNGTQLSLDNSVELEKQLQKLNIPASIFDEMRRYLREWTSNVDAIKEARKEVEDLDKQLNDIRSQRIISEEEVDKLREINEEYEKLTDADLSKEERQEILDNITELEEQKTQIQIDFSIKRLEEENKSLKESLENLSENSVEREKVLKKIADNEVAIEKNKNKLLKKKADKNKPDEEKKKIDSDKIEQAITDALEKQVDKRIELLDKEKNARQQQMNFLQGLAESGNITAQQSLSEEMELQKQAEKERQRLERRKANLQMISSGLQAFSKELEAGKSPGEALASTIASMKGLEQILSGLNFFYKGTYNAPQGLAWVDEKGAELHTDKHGNIKSFGSDKGANLRMLDKGDKIYPANKTKSILQQMSEMPHYSRIDNTGGDAIDNAMINEMKAIRRAVNNQESVITQFDSLTNSIIQSQRKRGVKKVIKHRLGR